MGTEASLVATALRAVVAQRLVRRLCDDCAEPADPSPTAREQLGFDIADEAGTWRRSVGCQKCRGSGYKGQIGVYEIIAVDDTLRNLITERHSASRLREYLRDTEFTDLRTQGRALVAAGLTTAEEILRVIPHRAEAWETTL
jgi:type II secretory ATPase GspE/PulE/Tfp pilus assembly ATPase PilB-like protein